MSSTISPRVLGLGVGTVVGMGFAGAVALIDAVGGANTVSPGVVPPILLGGAAGGWLMAPEGIIAHTRVGWLGVVARLAVVALVVGDAVVVAGLAWGPGWAVGSPLAAVQALESMGTLMIVGLVAVGWLVLPFALVASAMWAIAMRALAVHRLVVFER